MRRYIDGSINSQVVQIGGKVEGRVEAKRVKIEKSGEMFGDVVYESLEVESGSRFEGACKPLGLEPGIKQDAGDRSKGT